MPLPITDVDAARNPHFPMRVLVAVLHVTVDEFHEDVIITPIIKEECILVIRDELEAKVNGIVDVELREFYVVGKRYWAHNFRLCRWARKVVQVEIGQKIEIIENELGDVTNEGLIWWGDLERGITACNVLD